MEGGSLYSPPPTLELALLKIVKVISIIQMAYFLPLPEGIAKKYIVSFYDFVITFSFCILETMATPSSYLCVMEYL